MVWLSQKTVKEIADKLCHVLADTSILYIKTLNYHWNMVGPEFFMFHHLLEKQYKEMAEALDELAERIRMLKVKAPATMSEWLKLSCLKEGKSSLSQDRMVKDLVASHEALVAHCHEVVAFCDEVKDQGSSDLLVDRLRFHDKQAWLLRSHFTSSSLDP